MSRERKFIVICDHSGAELDIENIESTTGYITATSPGFFMDQDGTPYAMDSSGKLFEIEYASTLVRKPKSIEDNITTIWEYRGFKALRLNEYDTIVVDNHVHRVDLSSSNFVGEFEIDFTCQESFEGAIDSIWEHGFINASGQLLQGVDMFKR